jgi:hypothetical protein
MANTNATANQNTILTAVADAIAASGPNDNWTDAVDDALASIGVKTVTPERTDDPWVIAQLAEPTTDGSVIVFREGQGDGPEAYDIRAA